MWDGMPTVIPIQGAIVAAVFLVIAFVKVFRGSRHRRDLVERRRRYHASLLVHLSRMGRIRGSFAIGLTPAGLNR